MMNKKQQIAIIAKNVDPKLINWIVNQFSTPFSLITPNGNETTLKNVKVISDDNFLNRDAFFLKCQHRRPGWLYQQFLKYQVVIKSEFENTLVIDGDSLLKDEKFLTPFSLYHTQKTIENEYSNFISKTLGVNFLSTRNYITNQMNFNKETLISMLNTAFGSSQDYPDFIMDFLQQNPDSEFSEYQTYASWMKNKINQNSKLIKVFRRHDLINVNPLDSLKKYDLVAFEYGHKTDLFRTIRAHILYSFAINLG